MNNPVDIRENARLAVECLTKANVAVERARDYYTGNGVSRPFALQCTIDAHKEAAYAIGVATALLEEITE